MTAADTFVRAFCGVIDFLAFFLGVVTPFAIITLLVAGCVRARRYLRRWEGR
jgi:hypothetical protein